MSRIVKLLLIFSFIVLMNCTNQDRAYFSSHDDKKYITFISDPESSYNVYVIPGKWAKKELPDDNYIILSWSDVFDFAVNWESEKYRFAYPSVVKNKLDTSKVEFSKFLHPEEGVMIDGESHYDAPKVEGYLISSFFSGGYLEERETLVKIAQERKTDGKQNK
jgi:hypothetical protein